MTVNTIGITSGPYPGNGVADSFSYSFRVQNKNELKVFETSTSGVQTVLTVDTDYTVNNIGEDTGGTITRLAGPLPINASWYIRSNYQMTQDTEFTSQGAFFPELHENAMDKMTYLIQQLADQVTRSLRFPDSSSAGENGAFLPDPEALKLLRWKADLTGLENIDIADIDPEVIVLNDQVRKVNDLAGLRNLTNVVAGQTFIVKEHSFGLNVGGGVFHVDPLDLVSTDDDGVTIINADSGLRLKRQLTTHVHVEMYGVVSSSVDNSATLLKAATKAMDLLLPLYANPLKEIGVIRLNLNTISNLKIYGLNLKQIALAADSRSIFKNTGGGFLEFHGCRVNRNGTADALDPQTAIDAAGVWLQGFPGLKIRGFEVTGDGQGTGIRLINLTGNLDFEGFYVHDMTYYQAVAPTTEYLGGVSCENLNRFKLYNFVIENLYSKTGTDPVRRFQTDGIGCGGQNGCTRFSIYDGFIANVGEGIDVTGSGGNRDFTIKNIKAEDCGFASFKIANGNRSGSISNCTSVRAGWTGIALVGAGAEVSNAPENFYIHHNFIYDTGANPEISGGSITYDGIQIGATTLVPSTPRNVIIHDNTIIDRQSTKTMDYGIKFYDTVLPEQNIRIRNNTIEGFKVKRVVTRGVTNTLGEYMYASINSVGVSHPTSGSWVTYPAADIVYDENTLYAGGTYTIKVRGLYRIQASIVFATNATGLRGVRIKFGNGPGVIIASDVRSAVTGDSTTVSVSRTYMFEGNETFSIEYLQSSGGALSVANTGSFSEVSLVQW